MSSPSATPAATRFSIPQLLILTIAIVALILIFVYARLLIAPVLTAGIAAFVTSRLSDRRGLVLGVATAVGVVVFVGELLLLIPVSRTITSG